MPLITDIIFEYENRQKYANIEISSIFYKLLLIYYQNNFITNVCNVCAGTKTTINEDVYLKCDACNGTGSKDGKTVLTRYRYDYKKVFKNKLIKWIKNL